MDFSFPLNPALAVAFTGFRPAKIIASAPGYNISEIERILFERLRVAVRFFYNAGYNVYITGMADGFDLLAGEAVLSLRKELPELQLVCVAPFTSHGYNGTAEYRSRYQYVKVNTNYYKEISDKTHKGVFHDRNDYMLANCSVVICYFDGVQTGGTSYTVNKAIKLNRIILNLYLGKGGTMYSRGISADLMNSLRAITL